MLDSVSVPAETESVRLQTGSSGPASGSWIAMPSPDAVEKISGPVRDGAERRRRGLPASPCAAAETSEVLPCGSVAVAVMIGSPAGAVKGTAKHGLSGRVGRHLQRAQVVLGLARPVRVVGGAGEDIDVERRVRRAAPEPALELAAGGRDDDREVLEVVGALARCGRVVGHSIVAEVDGLSRVVEDAVASDLRCRQCRPPYITATPTPPLSVMRLPAPAAVPPIVLSLRTPVVEDLRYPVIPIAQIDGPRRVGADDVPLNDVVTGAATGDLDADVIVARDDVALAGVVDALTAGTDPVAGCAAVDHHTAAENAVVVVSEGAK